MTKQLHIVSFDVPFPPNYGGVIDVFYKIKALHKLGVKIQLHTYDYGRGKATELEEYCENVYYYNRNNSLLHVFSKLPFIVCSRNNKTLISNLKLDNQPILFEGMHTTFMLLKENFTHRTIFIRMHNIEDQYYDGLAKSEKNWVKKLFFKLEAKKLRKYESILQKADKILTISPNEQAYFVKKYGNKATYIPVFHKNEKIKELSAKGKYGLYHGDLRVSDNVKSVRFLIKVFKKLPHKLIIASSFADKNTLQKIKKYANIEFELLKSDDQNQLSDLFENAHVNVLPTFQKTGIKLKLIHALYESRFCLVTKEMTEDTGLCKLCTTANTKKDYSKAVNLLFEKEYSKNKILLKKNTLTPFNTLVNAHKIIELL